LLVNRILLSPPIIHPVAHPANRPLWSVMIPVYNCAAFLQDTLESVLAQALDEDSMQIEVIDDASTDADVASLVQEVGKGRIKYYRQAQNLGSLRNFETCLNRARGHLVHLLHGDDRVRPGYYQKMNDLFSRFPEAGAAFCRFHYIDEKGQALYNHQAESDVEEILDNWLVRLGQQQRIQYCSISVKREVYEKLGGFYGVTYGEDWEMWMRIARQYPMAYTPEVLADYRIHAQSISGQAFATAKNLKDLQWVINTFQAYLPESERPMVRKSAMKFYAHYALRVANRLWHSSYNSQGVKAQIREALRMHKDLPMYWKILKLYTKIIINYR
jgi:glycosyltransferase involved in cell wall biosynthesis